MNLHVTFTAAFTTVSVLALSIAKAGEPARDWNAPPPSQYEVGLTLGEAFNDVWLAEPVPAPASAPPSNPILNISPASGQMVPDWQDESYIQAVDFGFGFDQHRTNPDAGRLSPLRMVH